LVEATRELFVQTIHDLAVPRMAFGRVCLTLEDAFEFFNLVLELKLTREEKKDLVAFLQHPPRASTAGRLSEGGHLAGIAPHSSCAGSHRSGADQAGLCRWGRAPQPAGACPSWQR
jgi:hypothetical protein